MATPHVAGLAALIATMKNDLLGKDIKKLIMDNVQKKAEFAEFVTSGGIIDMEKTIKAVKAASSPPPPATTSPPATPSSTPSPPATSAPTSTPAPCTETCKSLFMFLWLCLKHVSFFS